jgi:hypothetical protein
MAAQFVAPLCGGWHKSQRFGINSSVITSMRIRREVLHARKILYLRFCSKFD